MPSPGSRFLRACSATGLFFFLKVTGRGENPPPEFHSLALKWPIGWFNKVFTAFWMVRVVIVFCLDRIDGPPRARLPSLSYTWVGGRKFLFVCYK